jgi:hypothetical protein
MGMIIIKQNRNYGVQLHLLSTLYDTSQANICHRPVRIVLLMFVVAYGIVENVEALRHAKGSLTTFLYRQDCRSLFTGIF